MEEKTVAGEDASSALVDNIQDEDLLRQMWTEASEGDVKKQIRLRMYKLREQRLKEFYNQEGILENIFKTGSSMDSQQSQLIQEIPISAAADPYQSEPELVDDLRPLADSQLTTHIPAPTQPLPALVRPRSMRMSKSPSPIPSPPKPRIKPDDLPPKTSDSVKADDRPANPVETFLQTDDHPLKLDDISMKTCDISAKPSASYTKSNGTSIKSKPASAKSNGTSAKSSAPSYQKRSQSTKMQQNVPKSDENLRTRPTTAKVPPLPPPKPKQRVYAATVEEQLRPTSRSSEKSATVAAPKTKASTNSKPDSKNSKILIATKNAKANVSEKRHHEATEQSKSPLPTQVVSKPLPRFMASTKSRENAANPNPNIKSADDRRSRSQSRSRRPTDDAAVVTPTPICPLVIKPGRGNKKLPPPPVTPPTISKHSNTRVSSVSVSVPAQPETGSTIRNKDGKPASAKQSAKTLDASLQYKRSDSRTLPRNKSPTSTKPKSPETSGALDIRDLDLLDIYLEQLSPSTKTDDQLLDQIKAAQFMDSKEQRSPAGAKTPSLDRRRDVQETGEEPIVTRTTYPDTCSGDQASGGSGCQPIPDFKSSPKDKRPAKDVTAKPGTKIPTRPGNKFSAKEEKQLPALVKTIKRPDARSRPSSSSSSSSSRSLRGSFENLKVSSKKFVTNTRLKALGIVSLARNVFEKKADSDEPTKPGQTPLQGISLGNKVRKNAAKFEAKVRGEPVVGDDAVVSQKERPSRESSQTPSLEIRPPEKFSIVELVNTLPFLKPADPGSEFSIIPAPLVESHRESSAPTLESAVDNKLGTAAKIKRPAEKTGPCKKSYATAASSTKSETPTKRGDTTADVAEQLFDSRTPLPKIRPVTKLAPHLNTTAQVAAELFSSPITESKTLVKPKPEKKRHRGSLELSKPTGREVSDLPKEESIDSLKKQGSKQDKSKPAGRSPIKSATVEEFLKAAKTTGKTQRPAHSDAGKPAGSAAAKPWGGDTWKPDSSKVVVGKVVVAPTSPDSTENLSEHLKLITSPYGGGPVDKHGKPLFGLAALRHVKQLDTLNQKELVDLNQNLIEDVTNLPKDRQLKELRTTSSVLQETDEVSVAQCRSDDDIDGDSEPPGRESSNTEEMDSNYARGVSELIGFHATSLPEINGTTATNVPGRSTSADPFNEVHSPRVVTEPQRKVRDITKMFEVPFKPPTKVSINVNRILQHRLGKNAASLKPETAHHQRDSGIQGHVTPADTTSGNSRCPDTRDPEVTG